MKPTKLMKVIGDADDEYILSAMATRKSRRPKRYKLGNIIGGTVLTLLIATLILWRTTGRAG